MLQKLGAAGLLGLMYESDYGGAEADALTNLVFAEALSQSTFGGFIITVLVHTDMASPHLHHAGTPSRRRSTCRASTAGARSPRSASPSRAPAPTSPASGHGRCAPATAAWILNGTKLFITNGVLADLYFIAAKTGSARSRDVDVHRREGHAGLHGRPPLDKSGWLSSDTAELVFENCRIPAANLLGEENRGFYSVMKNFQTERIALAAMAVGHAMQALA